MLASTHLTALETYFTEITPKYIYGQRFIDMSKPIVIEKHVDDLSVNQQSSDRRYTLDMISVILKIFCYSGNANDNVMYS